MISIDQFYNETIGKGYDIDGYYGMQCWDYFAKFVQMTGLPINTYCALTGYAGDLWILRYQYNYSKYFDFITNIKDLKDGDWCFWPAHVALYYHGKQVGQNQSSDRKVVSKTLNKKGVLGALRFREWQPKIKGVASHFASSISGSYHLRYDAVNLRSGGGLDYPVITLLDKTSTIRCYGYYAIDSQNKVWYYVIADTKTGFIRSDMVVRSK